ncbi:MAG TPA: hypothetical protein VF767_09670 [Bryobacteraceae bacterium]
MTPYSAAGKNSKDTCIREIAIQAEILALNFALEGTGAELAGGALHTLSREIKDALGPQLRQKPKLRLER